MRTFIPSSTPTKDEYIGTIYGTAALALMTQVSLADAFDFLEERTTYASGRKMRAEMATARFALSDALEAVNAMFTDRGGVAWAADFGNAAYERIAPHAMRLQFAIANNLGRFHGIEDTNAVAKLIVTQSIAHEAAAYTARRAELFKGSTVENRHGNPVSVSNLFRKMSIARTDKALCRMVTMILNGIVPDDLNLLDDVAVSNGCKIMMARLGDVDTWIYARGKADELNGFNKDDYGKGRE